MLLFVIDFIETNEKTYFTETNFYANLQFSDKIKLDPCHFRLHC